MCLDSGSLHILSFCSIKLSVHSITRSIMSTESELCMNADFSLMISERITKINKSLSPVTTILRLSADSSVIDQHLFDSMTHDDLVKLAVNMVTQLNDVKVLLKDCRTVLEDIDVTAPLHPAPQISTQISDLQSALNDLKISKPEPLDYSKLISGLEKPVKDAFKKLPIQKPVVNTKKQAREVAEFQARSCNVMVYNCLRCSVNDSALDVAKTYLMTCGVPTIEAEHERVVDAAFVKKSEDGRTCTVRVKMDSPWVVNTLLRDAKLLKSYNNEMSGMWTDDTEAEYYYRDSFITKDRTVAEQEERRKLVSELRERIASDSGKKWVIRFGKVEAVGDFIKHNR